MKFDLSKEFFKLVRRCGEALFDETRIVEIIYRKTSNIDAKVFRVDNKDSFEKIFKNGGNVYALWVKKNRSKKWVLMYVGQRKSKGIRTRLIEHLIKKHKDTGSQLHKIQKELANNGHIGVTCIRVEPDVLRHSVEEHLIYAQREKGYCSWNKHS